MLSSPYVPDSSGRFGPYSPIHGVRPCGGNVHRPGIASKIERAKRHQRGQFIQTCIRCQNGCGVGTTNDGFSHFKFERSSPGNDAADTVLLKNVIRDIGKSRWYPPLGSPTCTRINHQRLAIEIQLSNKCIRCIESASGVNRNSIFGSWIPIALNNSMDRSTRWVCCVGIQTLFSQGESSRPHRPFVRRVFWLQTASQPLHFW